MATLSQFEAGLVGAPSYQLAAAGAALTLRQRLNQGEAWSTGLLNALADNYRQPARDSG